MLKVALMLAAVLAFAPPAGSADLWTPLTSREAQDLRGSLKAVPKGEVIIACGGTWCRTLADDFAKVFTAAGWKVQRMRGGLGIDGLIGLRIHSCKVDVSKIAAVIERATSHKVEAIAEDCHGDVGSLFIVVGQP